MNTMNRRGFFRTVGAVVAGAVLGQNVQAQPNHPGLLEVSEFAGEFVIDGTGSLLWDAPGIPMLDDVLLNSSDRFVFTTDMTVEPLVSIAPDGTVTRHVSEPPAGIDFDYYDAWL